MHSPNKKSPNKNNEFSHGHVHVHSHGHSHHLHGGDKKVLQKAFILISTFMLVELGVGIWTNALVLLADAGHMFLDATALGLSWWAAHISERGYDQKLSYGYHRFQVLAAFVNGLTLVVLIVWISVEATMRLFVPEAILPLPALLVAIAGFVVNLIAFRWLHDASNNTNIRSAALHVLGDLLGSTAAILASLAVLIFGWLYADPVLTLLIVVILSRGAYYIVKESAHILLEGVPEGVNLGDIKTTLTNEVSDVIQIHHVHAWGLTAEKPLLTLHALVNEGAKVQVVVEDIKRVLRNIYNIEHSTIQVEIGPCPDDHGEHDQHSH
jgi:cobalt-zinc-cadmium efflux system protein